MKKTKAAFKAMREACGLSQSDIAAEADVSLSAVKKWENASYPHNQPPDDVWQFILTCHGAMHEDARLIAQHIIESLDTVDGAHDMQLEYYRTQEQLDDAQRGSGADEPIGYVNARMRLVGELLEQQEIPYTFRYPDTEKDPQH